MTRTIEVFAREYTTKDGNHKFYSYSSKINGTYYKIKFRQAVTNVPRAKGVYFVTFNDDNCSIEKDTQGYNDTLWIHAVDAIDVKPFDSENYQAEAHAKMVAEVFDTEDIPF